MSNIFLSGYIPHRKGPLTETMFPLTIIIVISYLIPELLNLSESQARLKGLGSITLKSVLSTDTRQTCPDAMSLIAYPI